MAIGLSQSHIGLSHSNSTLTLSGSTSSAIYTTTTTGSTIFTISNKVSYEVLGKKIEIDSTYGDPTMAMCIALINTLGIEYYAELKKQNISFHGKIADFLEENLKAHYRDQKIEQVL